MAIPNSVKIHPTAIIHDNAIIGEESIIGPYCIIGENVELGAKSILKSHIVLDGVLKVGNENIFYPFTSIGQDPQDLKFHGEKSSVEIGDKNIFREYVTIQKGTKDGNMTTKIGSNGLFMVGAHIAHDCEVGSSVIFANNATIAGHVKIYDDVVIGGLAAIHQHVRIGKGAMIGGVSAVVRDVLPYTVASGDRAYIEGVNTVGMRRRGYSNIDIKTLKEIYSKLLGKEDNFQSRVKNFNKNYSDYILYSQISEFVTQFSKRSFCSYINKEV